jgi:hypothetical protein
MFYFDVSFLVYTLGVTLVGGFLLTITILAIREEWDNLEIFPLIASFLFIFLAVTMWITFLTKTYESEMELEKKNIQYSEQRINDLGQALKDVKHE